MLGHFATAEALGHDEAKLLLPFSGSCGVLEVLVVQNLQDSCMRLFDGLRGGTAKAERLEVATTKHVTMATACMGSCLDVIMAGVTL